MTIRWGLLPDTDECGMAVGYGARCLLPGDHDGPCQMPPAVCICGHLHKAHGLDRKRRPNCYGNTVCACVRYQEKNQ